MTLQPIRDFNVAIINFEANFTRSLVGQFDLLPKNWHFIQYLVSKAFILLFIHPMIFVINFPFIN